MKRLKTILSVVVALAAAQSSAQQLILDGQAIDLDPNLPVTIEEDGDIVAFSAAGDLTCANVTTPPTVTLTASPTSLNGAGNVTLSWTTQFADSCTPSNGTGTSWPSTNITLPSGQTTITNLTSTTAFTLTCDNVLGMASETASVTVSSNDEYGGFPPPGDCGPTEQPPAGTTHENPLEIFGQNSRLVVTNNFEGPFGEGWPAIQNSKEDIFIGRNQWAALGFIAGQAASCTGTGCSRSLGRIEWDTSIFGDAPKVVSISRCPGDFNTELGSCRVSVSPLLWQYGAGFGCNLTVGQQYYLNIIHGNAIDPSQTECGANECAALINVR